MKEHKIFIYIFLIVGMLLVFVIPPFNSPDEDCHFKKAYSVSVGQFVPTVVDGKQGNYLPENLVTYIEEQKKLQGYVTKKYNFGNFYINEELRTLSENIVFNEYSHASNNPIIYVIPAIGINISRLVSLIMGNTPTVASLLYGARIISLLFYGTIIYLIIKNIPKYKKTIMAISLMPMTIFLFSSVNYDHALITASLMLFYLVTKYRNNEKNISLRDLLIIIFIAFIFLLLKKIYIFSLLSLLLIPKNKFKFKDKKNLKYIISLILVLVAIYIVPKIFAKEVSIISNSSSQISFVLHNPFKYLSIYIHSFFSNRFYYLTTFIGTLGLLDTQLPYFIVFMYVIFLVITFIVDFNDEKGLKLKERVLSTIINIIPVSLSFLAMYIYWTADHQGVGNLYITGVQGRYFIPCFVFLPFLFMNNFKSPIFKKMKKMYEENYVVMYIIVLSITLFISVARFWI